MTKAFGYFLGKTLCVFLGYMGFISMLRASSQTFRVVFETVFANNLRFAFFPSMFVAGCSVLLFLVFVFYTKREKISSPLAMWRTLDMSTLAFLGFWLSAFSLILIYTGFQTQRGLFSIFFLSLLAFFSPLVVLGEFTARIRDKVLRQSFYWPLFFKAYPLYKPLGLLFAMVLVVNLFLLLSVMTSPLHFRGIGGIAAFLFLPGWTVAADVTNLMLTLSLITVITLSYFAAHLLNLSSKYQQANLEKIQSERFKSELITNVSHDIYTPLTSIINYVDLLKGQSLTGTSAQYVQVLDKKSARLKMLIRDLMDASKAGTGNVSVHLESINLTELMGQVAGEFDREFTEKNLSLVLREPENPVFAYGDSRHLWRTLENIFSNAAKYSLAGTRVFAECSIEGEHRVFTLKNTSESPIELSGEALAERFIRGDLSRESEGSGLGLYIAKSLVELMDGQFSIFISGDLFQVKLVLPKVLEKS